MKTDLRFHSSRIAPWVMSLALALGGPESLRAAGTATPGIRGMARGSDGRMVLQIVPAGAAGESIDVYSSESLTSPKWRLSGAYLRPGGQSQMYWSESQDPGLADAPKSRFFRLGRADVDLNENGISDARESLLNLYVLPVQSQARWARAGLNMPVTNYTTVLSVKTYGAKGNGTNDDTSAVSTTISKATAGSVVYFPAGTYRLTKRIYPKSNMILRGDGAALTSLIFEGSNTLDRCIGIACWDGDQPTNYVAVTGGMTVGSAAVTVSSVAGFAAGDIIEIEEDNDPVWNLTSSWQSRLPGQINRVTAVDAANKRLTFDHRLRHTYTAARNPRLRHLITIQNAGIENLFIRRKDAIDGVTIELKYAVRCWVRNVESYMTYKAHVWLDHAFECEARQNYFHDSFVFGGDGQGYGVCSGKHTSDCLVENNVFYHLRHSMIVGIGANGNVYGYNSSSARALDPVHGTLQPDISVHGNYVYMNLFEGNVLEDADVPDYYEPAGPGNTLFRNRISNSGTAIDVGSDYENFIGNVLTKGTITLAKSLQGIVDHENVKNGSLSTVSLPCADLPDSLYRSVPPDFILNAAGVSWPAIGPDLPLNAPTPSLQRSSSGAYIP